MYSDILEKVTKKLLRWNISSLSLAGRVTLAQSVLQAISYYSMQTTSYPASVCDNIERACHSFIWGNTNNDRQLSLVKWSKLCNPKSCGDLGMCEMRIVNDAFLMKLGWGMIMKPGSLWVRVLKSKYGISDMLF